MPIVKRSNLPTYDRLIKEGRPVLQPDRAKHQDIRALHIGFLNLMPDAALEATERQWFRLIGESNRVAQIHIHPFNLPTIKRSAETLEYIDKYYDNFEDLKTEGLDALIITGANEETNPHVSDVATWGPLWDILQWSYENTASTICSCIASHVLLTYKHQQEPSWRKTKRLGIFSHRVLDRSHPLIRGMNTTFDAPHSRFSEISREQFDKAGITTLVEGKESGVYMSVSADGFRQIGLQGHPEYDTMSLLKEYKRDVNWYRDGTVKDYPVVPENYFGPQSQNILDQLKENLLKGEQLDFPEAEIEALIENTWADSARSFIAGWIGHVYQVTNVDRTKQFMDGVDPNNPLGQ